MLGGTGVATAGVLNAARRATGITGPPNEKSLHPNTVPNELPSITERTTQLVPAEDARTNKLIDNKSRGSRVPNDHGGRFER